MFLEIQKILELEEYRINGYQLLEKNFFQKLFQE